MSERFDCLLSWCSGNPATHGGTHEDPLEWVHSPGLDALAPGYTGEIMYFAGNDQACYYVCGDDGHELTATETEILADQLEAAARIVRARAAQLTQINCELGGKS